VLLPIAADNDDENIKLPTDEREKKGLKANLSYGNYVLVIALVGGT
jgi:hypothetical protein